MQFMSPELRRKYEDNDKLTAINFEKNDVFATGLVILAFYGIDIVGMNSHNGNWNGGLYSLEKLCDKKILKIVTEMLEFDPKRRKDFNSLENLLNEDV